MTSSMICWTVVKSSATHFETFLTRAAWWIVWSSGVRLGGHPMPRASSKTSVVSGTRPSHRWSTLFHSVSLRQGSLNRINIWLWWLCWVETCWNCKTPTEAITALLQHLGGIGCQGRNAWGWCMPLRSLQKMVAYDIVYPLTMSLRWVFLKTGHANMVQNQGDNTKLRNGRWFSPTFWKIWAKKFCQEERLPCSRIMQSVKQDLPETSSTFECSYREHPHFHPSDPATSLFQRADREHPQALQKEERTRQGGLLRHSFWTLYPAQGFGTNMAGHKRRNVKSLNLHLAATVFIDSTRELMFQKSFFVGIKLKANAPHFLSCSNLIRSKTIMTPQQQSQKPGWCRYYFAKSTSLIGKIQPSQGKSFGEEPMMTATRSTARKSVTWRFGGVLAGMGGFSADFYQSWTWGWTNSLY